MSEKSISKGFHHLAVIANDMDKSVEFYKKLGFKLKCTFDLMGNPEKPVTMLDMGDGRVIEIFSNGKDEPADGRYKHIAIAVDDVKEAYETALAAGATSRQEPKILHVDSKPIKLNMEVAFVFGLDGEVIEFVKDM